MNKTTSLIARLSLLLLAKVAVVIVIGLVIFFPAFQIIYHFEMSKVIEFVAYFSLGCFSGMLSNTINERIFKNINQKLDNEIEEIEMSVQK